MSARNRPSAKAARRAARASKQPGILADVKTYAVLVAGDAAGERTLVSSKGPCTTVIMNRWTARTMRAPMDYCEHIGPGRPPAPGNPAGWLAWEEDRLRCGACFATAVERGFPAAECMTCDSCRKPATAPGAPMHSMATRLRDVTLFFGLCPECFTADQAGSEA